MKACKNCGFLSQMHPDTGEHIEVSQDMRENPIRYGMFAMSICFVGAFDLEREVQESKYPKKVTAISEAFNKDRSSCPEWLQWRPGSSPKEHRQIQDLENEREREDKEWRWGVIRIGLLLVVATLVGPILAVLLNNCVFGGN